ncbi:MAG: DUF3422 domain-containing protein [Hyphomicrobiaceae bacterium]
MGETPATKSTTPPGPKGLRPHAERPLLLGELHARPFLPLSLPQRIYHYAFITSEEEARADRANISLLALNRGLPQPAADAKFCRIEIGTWELRWEQHTEFTTYTWVTGLDAATPFTKSDPLATSEIAFVAPGALVSAVHISLVKSEVSAAPLDHRFDPQAMCVVDVNHTAARLTTDFLADASGYTRLLIESRSLTPIAAGRLVQRVLEIETYRTLALLGLPEARRTALELSAMERDLSDVTSTIAASPDASSHQKQLRRLTSLAVSLEASQLRTAHRFAASRAYFELTSNRLEVIGERPVEENISIAAFFRRRLEPAIATCNATEARQARLAQRLERTTDLLRTGIQFELEHQNRDLLDSMNKRADLQLRLQQTVEGLSVAAISYYVVGLITYVAKGVKDLGLLPKPLSPELVTAALVPVVVLVIWWSMRKLHHKFMHE